MSNLHRIQWFDQKLRSRLYPNSRDICEKFEISSRQALRDIYYLKCSLNAPIQYSHSRKGYYYTEETYRIPSEMLSDSESKLLYQIIQNYRGEDQQKVQKLRSIFLKEEVSANNWQILQILRMAIDGSKKVELDVEGKRIDGKVLPLLLEFYDWDNRLTNTVERKGWWTASP